MKNANSSPTNNSPLVFFNREEYLMRFAYSDGFCERLLSIELLVDLDLNFELSFNTFLSEKTIKQGTLPDPIRSELVELTELDLSLLKEAYAIHNGATDFPSYTLTINQFSEIWNYTIGMIPVTSESHSEAEIAFFSILLDLRNFLINQTGHEIS